MATALKLHDARLKPFVHGWKRELLRFRTHNDIEKVLVSYITPMGVRVNTMDEVWMEQRRMKSTLHWTYLNDSNFVFTPEIIYHPPYEVMKLFDLYEKYTQNHDTTQLSAVIGSCSSITALKENQLHPYSNLRKHLLCKNPNYETINKSNTFDQIYDQANRSSLNSSIEGPSAKRRRLNETTVTPDSRFHRAQHSSESIVKEIFNKLAKDETAGNNARNMWVTKPADGVGVSSTFASTQALKRLMERSAKLGVKGYTCLNNMELPDDKNMFKMPTKYRSPCTEYCWDDRSFPDQDCHLCQVMFHANCSKRWVETLLNSNSKWIPSEKLPTLCFENTCSICATYEIESLLKRELKKSVYQKVHCQLKLTFENPMPASFKKRLPHAICWLHGKIKSFPPELVGVGDYKLDSELAAHYSSYKLKMNYTTEFDRFIDRPEVYVVHEDRVQLLSGDNFVRNRHIMTVTLENTVVLSKSLKPIVFFCPLPSNECSPSQPVGLQIPTVDVSDNEESQISDCQEESCNASKEEEPQNDEVDTFENSDDDKPDIDKKQVTTLETPQSSISTEVVGMMEISSNKTVDVEQPYAAANEKSQESMDMRKKVEMDDDGDLNAVNDEQMETEVIPEDILVEVVSIGTGVDGATVDGNTIDTGKHRADEKSSVSTGDNVSDDLVQTPETYDLVSENMDEESEVMGVETRDVAVDATTNANIPRYLVYSPSYKDLGRYRILDIIFSHLDTVSLLRCRRVCRDWKRTIDSSPTLCGGRFSPRTGYQLVLQDVPSLFHWLMRRQVVNVDLREVELSAFHVQNFVRMVELNSALWPAFACLSEVKLKYCPPELLERIRETVPQLRIVGDGENAE